MTDWLASYEERQAAMTPGQRAGNEAAMLAGSAVVRIARAAGTEVQERPLYHGAVTTTFYAAPADGIRYAQLLAGHAAREVEAYIRLAREDGMTWRQAGEALGLADAAERDGGDLAVMAYEHATNADHAQPFDQLTFYWTCPACGQGICDRGPYESHPEDNEHGHGPGCSRLAAAVAEHDARIAEWEG